jgi:hypothetical protein
MTPLCITLLHRLRVWRGLCVDTPACLLEQSLCMMLCSWDLVLLYQVAAHHTVLATVYQ